MNKSDIALAVFDSHTQADAAVRSLAKAGFDMKTISIVGKDYHTEEHAVGYLNAGDRAKFFGKLGAFWGGLAGILFGSALMFVRWWATSSCWARSRPRWRAAWKVRCWAAVPARCSAR